MGKRNSKAKRLEEEEELEKIEDEAIKHFQTSSTFPSRTDLKIVSKRNRKPQIRPKRRGKNYVVPDFFSKGFQDNTAVTTTVVTHIPNFDREVEVSRPVDEVERERTKKYAKYTLKEKLFRKPPPEVTKVEYVRLKDGEHKKLRYNVKLRKKLFSYTLLPDDKDQIEIPVKNGIYYIKPPVLYLTIQRLDKICLKNLQSLFIRIILRILIAISAVAIPVLFILLDIIDISSLKQGKISLKDILFIIASLSASWFWSKLCIYFLRNRTKQSWTRCSQRLQDEIDKLNSGIGVIEKGEGIRIVLDMCNERTFNPETESDKDPFKVKDKSDEFRGISFLIDERFVPKKENIEPIVRSLPPPTVEETRCWRCQKISSYTYYAGISFLEKGLAKSAYEDKVAYIKLLKERKEKEEKEKEEKRIINEKKTRMRLRREERLKKQEEMEECSRRTQTDCNNNETASDTVEQLDSCVNTRTNDLKESESKNVMNLSRKINVETEDANLELIIENRDEKKNSISEESQAIEIVKSKTANQLNQDLEVEDYTDTLEIKDKLISASGNDDILPESTISDAEKGDKLQVSMQNKAANDTYKFEEIQAFEANTIQNRKAQNQNLELEDIKDAQIEDEGIPIPINNATLAESTSSEKLTLKSKENNDRTAIESKRQGSIENEKLSEISNKLNQKSAPENHEVVNETIKDINNNSELSIENPQTIEPEIGTSKAKQVPSSCEVQKLGSKQQHNQTSDERTESQLDIPKATCSICGDVV